MENSIIRIISSASDAVLAAAIINAYKEVEKNYFLKVWKSSELDSGHFVEAIRRFIEYKLFGYYPPIGTNLSNFNNATLQRYENASGDETYRIIIPRALFSIYTIRNKRGVGHIGLISPNHQDATLILSTCSWCLAELIRVESQADPNTTINMIEHIIERNIEGLWEEGDIKRILAENLSIKELILFLLYNDSPQHDTDLLNIIEYSNENYFKKVLRELHGNRLIEYRSNGECVVSPKGRIEAEKIIVNKIKV